MKPAKKAQKGEEKTQEGKEKGNKEQPADKGKVANDSATQQKSPNKEQEGQQEVRRWVGKENRYGFL